MGRFRYSVPAAVAFALLFVGVSTTSTFAQTANGTTVSVTGTGGTGVNFRVTPGGAAIGSFPDGTKLLVVGENKQANARTWRNVRSPDGIVGWVASDYLSGTASAPESTTTQAAFRPGATSGGTVQVVKTGGLNAIMRDAPSGAQIASYPEGTALSLVSAESREAGGRDWRNVQGPDGKTGWMASFLISDTTGATVAGGRTTVSAARSPFTLTSDMRARALAARARAVPLAATTNQNEAPSNKQTSTSSSSSSSGSSTPPKKKT
ncbi:MAG: SH3 domain-containing protein [Chloroflexota bacterium]